MGISLSVAECCCETDNGLILVSKKRNLLFELLHKEGGYRIVGSIPEESYYTNRLVGSIEKYNERIVVIPGKAKSIWIYNLQNYKWEKIEIKEKEMLGEIKFLSSCIYGDKIYMFGCHYPAIVVLDLRTGKVEYDFEVLGPIYEYVQRVSDCFFRTDFVIKNNNVYLACCSKNMVLKYSLNSNDYEWISVGKDTDRFSGLAFDGKTFWLAPRYIGDVIRWDEKKEKRYPIKKMNVDTSKLFSLGVTIDSKKNVVISNMNYNYEYVKTINNDTFEPVLSKNKLLYKSLNNSILSVDENGYIKYYINGIKKSYIIKSDDKKVVEYSVNNKNHPDFKINDYVMESEISFKEFIELI